MQIKRQRSNDSLSFAPNDFQFNFVPKTQSNQRIFDSDIPEATRELSALTLTKRYQNRIKKQFNIRQWTIPRPTPNQYESVLVKHQNVAYTLVIYFQALFNIILSLAMLYMFIQIIVILRHDFNIKVDEQLEGIRQDIKECTRNYALNHCELVEKVPAIERLCQDWKVCMEKDVVVAKAKISVEVIAEIINSFTEPISYKTMLFFSILTVGSLIFSNMAIGVYKKNHTRHESLAITHHQHLFNSKN